ncbi:MAG: hypothetical protein QOH01_2495 [Verrucomicrobiota bacterium]|jgi:hypothetical protein
MTRTTFISLLALLLIRTSQAHLDLTPAPTEYVAEGITFQRLTFKQANNISLSYQPPRGWTYRGGGDRLQLTPAEATRAEALIQALPLASAQPLDEKNEAFLREQFLNTLPTGSQVIKLLNEEQNPVVLDNKPSYAVTASYQVIGETFVRSTLFINLADTQLRFTLNARQSDYEKLNRAFRQSIYSWHAIETSPAAVRSEAAIATALAP